MTNAPLSSALVKRLDPARAPNVPVTGYRFVNAYALAGIADTFQMGEVKPNLAEAVKAGMATRGVAGFCTLRLGIRDNKIVAVDIMGNRP